LLVRRPNNNKELEFKEAARLRDEYMAIQKLIEQK
jgi:excinuclease UvrABC nuclease subunit